MPVEVGIWRIDGGVDTVSFSPLDLESRRETILDSNIDIAAPNWMVLGRQVPTDHAGFIDLLAMDFDGNLVVVELKRDKSPREIVAQVLDYGAWVVGLADEDIAQIFEAYLTKWHPSRAGESINDAFCARFNTKQMPEELNTAHQLVVVASSLDPATERVVRYLSEYHGVQINAVFFRVFKDEEREYLTRAWLVEPSLQEVKLPRPVQAEWNGEYYGSFGGNENRDWDEARKYGFFAAGGGRWYTNTLSYLIPGARLWVNVPGVGYVGVGLVEEGPVPIDDFVVKDEAGQDVPLLTLPIKARGLNRAAEDEDTAEQLVRVRWEKTVPASQAIREKGFFGNQNSVARPRDPRWQHTVERLKVRFGVG
jgi:hypothetical protein